MRRVLLRGLSVKADARYPSMNALLAALQADPTARTRRPLMGVLALGAVAGAAVAASVAGTAPTVAAIDAWRRGPAARR